MFACSVFHLKTSFFFYQVNSQHLLSEEMRDDIKKHMIALYFTTTEICKKYILLCLQEISNKDLPDFWPTFFTVRSILLSLLPFFLVNLS